jgi:hypothetical protein
MVGASRYYAEASKLGTEQSLMTLTVQTSTDASGVDTATRITAAMGAVDEKVTMHDVHIAIHTWLYFTYSVSTTLARLVTG